MVLVLLAGWMPPPPGEAGGWVFILGGILCLAGAASSFIAMLVSHMTFGFGVSTSHDETWVLFFLPPFQALFGLASIALGVSSTCAGWAGRLLSP